MNKVAVRVFRLWWPHPKGRNVAVIGHLPGLEVTAMSASGVPGDARWWASARRGARPDILTARVAGALLIAATVASLLSTGLLNPVFARRVVLRPGPRHRLQSLGFRFAARSPLRPDRIRWSNRDNDTRNWWIWTRSRTRAFAV
jgi:hypothetical protein